MVETFPIARLLDLSRLAARAGRGIFTGIDRVEFAYLQELLRRPDPLFALVRSTLGFVLLDRQGVAALASRLNAEVPWGRADPLGRISQRRSPLRARVEADLRRLALGRASPAGLIQLLGRHLPAGIRYLNTGHDNWQARIFDAVHTLPGGRVSVLVHDTIPLDYPQFAAPGVPKTFADGLRVVGKAADLVIYNSMQTCADAERHFAGWGRIPPGIVSLLGTELAPPDPSLVPPDLDLSRPYFVTLGTIEPRKNHALLLDVWDDFRRNPPPGGIPQLLIIGRRGWNNDPVFRRLDEIRAAGGPVRELPGLPDGAVTALLEGSAGLLFPSLAEGYGLPPVEAAALKVPVVCSDLEVYRESIGNYPVYVDSADRYLWATKIGAMVTVAGRTEEAGRVRQLGPAVRTWQDHFNPVLRLT